MAGRKDYEQRFILNAQLNGGFSSTFSRAQQEFARLGKEIKTLEQVQKDVSAYQKQQEAIQNTDKKLRNLQSQQAAVAQQMGSASADALPALEEKYLKLDQRIGDTTAALERQKQKLTDTGARLKEAGVDTGNLAQKDAELTAKIKELEEEQKRAAEGAQTFGEKAAEGFSAAGAALAAAGVIAGVRQLTDAFAACVGAAGDFEEAMSTVEALSQANAREMAALSAEAKELGATTKFTAKESADAMGYMAMAGWDAQEMLSGMNGVLQLAAASGEDLAMVSDIVTDSLSAFGLTAADTAHFADVLAAAATNSNTNVSIMGETFKMSASVAGALGYSIEDVAAAMGLMANSGVKGSIAGTALRNTFNGLLAGVTLTGRAFGEYEYSAVRADGTMKSFGATIEELRGYFQQMTEAERVSNAQAIAGQRGYNGLLAILNAADADYQSLTNSINNCAGAAERMAAVRMDNLKGQVTLMNSAWDALKTTIGEQFIPELRALSEAGTDALTWVDGFIKDHPALTKGVMAFTGVLGGAAVAITGVNAALKLFQALNVAAMFTTPVGAILGVGAAIAGVAGLVVGMNTAFHESVPPVKELTEAARNLERTMEETAAAYDKTAEETLAAANVADTYVDRLEAMGDYAGLSSEKQREYHDILSLLCQTVPELADSIDLTNNTIQGGTAALRANTEGWKQNALAQAMQDRLTAMYAAQADALLEVEKNRLKLTETQVKADQIESRRADALKRMNELSREAQRLGEALPREYYDLQNSLVDLGREYQTAVAAVRAYETAMAQGSDAAAEAEAEIHDYTAAMDHLTGAAAEQAGVLPELENALSPVRNELDQLAAAYNDAYDAALGSMEGQYALWDQAAEVVPTSAASINAALESQTRYWQDYNRNIQTLLNNAGEIAGLHELLAGLDAGDKDTVNFVAGLAQASKTDKQALEEMVRNWQEAKQAQEEAAGSFSEYASGLAEEMGCLQEEVKQAIADMDLSGEAAESARNTIQAYIDQTEAMKGPLRSAFAGLWQGALDTLPAVPAVVPVSDSGNARAKMRPGRGYASGTQSAVPGWAWVGEEGPELMRFRGGERVLTAEESAAMVNPINKEEQRLRGLSVPPAGVSTTARLSVQPYINLPDEAQRAGMAPSAGPAGAEPLRALPLPRSNADAAQPVSVQLNIHIDGGGSSEAADAFRNYIEGEDFRETIMEVFQNARADAMRSEMR